MKKRKCAHCKNYENAEAGIVINTFYFCSRDHAVLYAMQNKNKAAARSKLKSELEARKKLNQAKREARPRGWYVSEAQKWFNKYIRLRDAGLGCISCGIPLRGKYDAGHYRSVGANPELRFNESNVHGQCVRCNQHLHGNLINYRIGLLTRIGAAEVDILEGAHPAAHYSIDDLKKIIEKYKRCSKILLTTR